MCVLARARARVCVCVCVLIHTLISFYRISGITKIPLSHALHVLLSFT